MNIPDLFAYVGPDEFTNQIGVKRGMLRGQLTAACSMDLDVLTHPGWQESFKLQAGIYRKQIILARFSFADKIFEINP